MFVIFNPFLDNIDRRFHSSVDYLHQNDLRSQPPIDQLNHSVILIIGRLFEPLLNDMACHRISQVHRPETAPSVSLRERSDLALSGMPSNSIVYV